MTVKLTTSQFLPSRDIPGEEGPAALYVRMPGDSENAQNFSFHSQNARKIEKKVRIRDSVES